MQNFSFHTHTNFSDGNNTLEEMIDRALHLGFKEIGISDHLIVHKNIKQSPSWNLIKDNACFSDFNQVLDLCRFHADEIRKIGRQKGIKTFVGYEVDYFIYNGWEDEFRSFLKQIDYDYLISGNHFFMSQNGEDMYDIWRFKSADNFAPEDTTVYLKRHFEAMRQAVQSTLFLFLAHLDYAQRTEDYKESNYKKEIENLIDALKETNTGCEISTKGIRKFGHFYPSENILSQLIKKDIPIIISDDAHLTDELGLYFAEAEEMLQKLGCRTRLKF